MLRLPFKFHFLLQCFQGVVGTLVSRAEKLGKQIQAEQGRADKSALMIPWPRLDVRDAGRSHPGPWNLAVTQNSFPCLSEYLDPGSSDRP